MQWIKEPYICLYNTLVSRVTNIFEKSDKDLYTLHDHSHCQSVESMIKAIIQRTENKFNDLEVFLLFSSAWIHDIGMSKNIAKDYFSDMQCSYSDAAKRKEHHNISCWYLQKEGENLFFAQTDDENAISLKKQLPNFIRTISIIIRYHRKKEKIKDCEKNRRIKDVKIRVQLLASILRFADSLHIDSSRVDYSLYALLQMTYHTKASRLHWLTAFFVSNVYLDDKNQVLTVNLDLPDNNKFLEYGIKKYNNENREREARTWEESIKNLEYIISSDIYSELIVLNEIFANNNMPTYVDVKVETAFIPGFDKTKYDEIKSVLSELDIIFSPNTSRVITRALDSIEKLIEKAHNSPEDFPNQLGQLLNNLKSIYLERPGHVTLGKIVKFLTKFDTDIKKDDIDSNTNILKKLVEYVKKKRGNATTDLYNKSENVIEGNVERLFLFGFSSTVIGIINKLSDDICSDKCQNLIIYVLEGATKRKYTHNNQIEYSDGIHYAHEIRKLKNFDIYIVPDVGFSSLLTMFHGYPLGCMHDGKDAKQYIGDQDNVPSPSSSLVLLGANGIDEEGNCAVSSGHLSVAIIANNFDVPVKIVSDSFKFGNINWNQCINSERNNDWLTSQKMHQEELKRNKINLINYREDRIPSFLIDKLHTEICDVEFRDIEQAKNSIAILRKNEKQFNNEIEEILTGREMDKDTSQ